MGNDGGKGGGGAFPLQKGDSGRVVGEPCGGFDEDR